MSLKKKLFEHEELNLVQSVFSEKNLFLFYEKKKKKKLQKAFWVEINQCLFFLIGFKMEHFDASLSTYFRAWLGPRGKVVLSLALPSFLPLLVTGNLWILHEDSLETMLIFQWLDTRGLESWSHEQVQGPLTAGAETQVREPLLTSVEIGLCCKLTAWACHRFHHCWWHGLLSSCQSPAESDFQNTLLQ